ncbi:hypothetical protein [Clostridium sp.]|uniref:hypothetical protein n=1 Tax=Clostridium sp. TaxID=1506 RepID=UPI00260629B4|nr:hypothetical protein [Clostridium sp.]
MFNKKIILGLGFFVIVIFLAFIKINIINTKALSPTGDGENNHDIISQEFGEDFEEFIRDNAEVKIYPGEGSIENTIIRIKDKEFIINTNHVILDKAMVITDKLVKNIFEIKDNINSKIKDLTKKIKIKDENKDVDVINEIKDDKLKGIVDDLIENLD